MRVSFQLYAKDPKVVISGVPKEGAEKMKTKIQSTFEIELADQERGKEIVKTLRGVPAKTFAFQSFLALLDDSKIERSQLQIAGPSFSIHQIREEGDPPRPYPPSGDMGVDPKVVIGTAPPPVSAERLATLIKYAGNSVKTHRFNQQEEPSDLGASLLAQEIDKERLLKELQQRREAKPPLSKN